jgi:hypothetical protein
MYKDFSLDEEYWTDDFSDIIDGFLDRHGGDEKEIIGLKYYEGEKIPVSTKELISADAIIDTINERAYEVMGERGEDYPCLDEQGKEELLNLLAEFLDKKDPHGFFHVRNAHGRKITEKDLEAKDERH